MTPLRRSLESLRAWRERSKPLGRKTALRAGPPLQRKKRLNPFNRRRKARLFERNFGEKSDWIRSLPCDVTGEVGRRIQAGHTRPRGMGGCGGSKEDLVPMAPEVNDSFDNESEATFKSRFNRTKDSVKARAPLYEARWQEFRRSRAA